MSNKRDYVIRYSDGRFASGEDLTQISDLREACHMTIAEAVKKSPTVDNIHHIHEFTDLIDAADRQCSDFMALKEAVHNWKLELTGKGCERKYLTSSAGVLWDFIESLLGKSEQIILISNKLKQSITASDALLETVTEILGEFDQENQFSTTSMCHKRLIYELRDAYYSYKRTHEGEVSIERWVNVYPSTKNPDGYDTKAIHLTEQEARIGLSPGTTSYSGHAIITFTPTKSVPQTPKEKLREVLDPDQLDIIASRICRSFPNNAQELIEMANEQRRTIDATNEGKE